MNTQHWPTPSDVTRIFVLVLNCCTAMIISYRVAESADRWADAWLKQPRIYFNTPESRTVAGPETYAPAPDVPVTPQPTLVPEPIDTPLPEPERPPRSRLLPPLPEPRPDRET